MGNFNRIHYLLTQTEESTVDTLNASPDASNESEPTDLYDEPE